MNGGRWVVALEAFDSQDRAGQPVHAEPGQAVQVDPRLALDLFRHGLARPATSAERQAADGDEGGE